MVGMLSPHCVRGPLTVPIGEKSEATKKLRKGIKDSCEQLILDFFGDEERGQVAIYDANNGTKASRKALGDKFEKEGVHVIFLGICSTPLIGVRSHHGRSQNQFVQIKRSYWRMCVT